MSVLYNKYNHHSRDENFIIPTNSTATKVKRMLIDYNKKM